MKFIKEKCAGNIFIIPLYLPAYQTWRDREDSISYGKYKFHIDDNYAFGRIIDDYKGGGDLIEVFRYIGKIPSTSTVITTSGRLFEPLHISMVFSKKRYPFIFSDDEYNKYQESDYKNISFLLMTEIWKGGEKTEITQMEKNKLELDGVPWWIIYTGTQLKNRVRIALNDLDIELNYDQIVEQRKEEYPIRKVTAVALRKELFPFVWSDDNKMVVFSLDTGSFRNNLFVEHGLLGNGYEWEKLFLNFISQTKPELIEKIVCDSEADTFSITSLDKKEMEVVALAFRRLCENKEEFKSTLLKLK